MWTMIPMKIIIGSVREADLYGRPTLSYVGQLSLYFPRMLHVTMIRDLTHMQLSDLQGELRPTCRTSDQQIERILMRRT